MNVLSDHLRFLGRASSLLWGALLFFTLLPEIFGQVGVSAERPTISVDVNLVVLHVTVRDRNGAFVSGLRSRDFRVKENGRPQLIRLFQHEDMPVSVGLIVDNSMSMRRKRRDVTGAALTFARSSNPRDEMFVVNFNERVSLGLPAMELFSTSSSELERALNGVPASGRTALYDAIESGLAHLKSATRDKKVLIIVSDGGDNASRHHLSQVLQDAESSEVILYTIGLFDEQDADTNPGVLRKLARATGGEAFLPGESSQVEPICQRIAEDIRHQYTIGYAPSDPQRNGGYRAIKLTATRPQGGELRVRTREGYIASEARTEGAGAVAHGEQR